MDIASNPSLTGTTIRLDRKKPRLEQQSIYEGLIERLLSFATYVIHYSMILCIHL